MNQVASKPGAVKAYSRRVGGPRTRHQVFGQGKRFPHLRKSSRQKHGGVEHQSDIFN